MGTLVSYQPGHSVATITMDDGKVNALSPQMLSELGAALDRAAKDRAVVVLTGRPGTFRAGFDLRVLQGGGAAASAMVQAGFERAERLLSFPTPVLIACTGHTVAMGAFLLLSGDYSRGQHAGHADKSGQPMYDGIAMTVVPARLNQYVGSTHIIGKSVWGKVVTRPGANHWRSPRPRDHFWSSSQVPIQPLPGCPGRST